MRKKLDTPDQIIARIAASQHGIVTTVQLLDAGLTAAGITRRIKAGRLHRVYRGIYAVGHRKLSIEGKFNAAVLACGEGAALSHRNAAELWEMLKPRGGLVHVTVPSKNGRAVQRGIRLHRSPSVLSVTTRHKDIAVTTPARTIADLRKAGMDVDELRRAIRQAEFDHLNIEGESEREKDLTRSWLERRFKAMCRRHKLALPEVNAHAGPHEVDFLWRDRMLVVETDSWRAHSGRQAFEDDRAKDAELKALGYTVLRFTYKQVTERWAWVERKVRALLA